MSNGQKKALHPMAWVAIGCAGLLLVDFLVVAVGGAFAFKKGKEIVEEMEANPTKTAAELFVKLNPELELIETDEATGMMTIRNKKTEETVTLDYEAVKDGRIEWKNQDGERNSISIAPTETSDGAPAIQISTPEGDTQFGGSVDLSEVPNWVPAYPGALDREGTFSSDNASGISGAYSFKSPDKPSAVIEYYDKLLTGQGFEVSKQSFDSSGASGGNISGTRASDGRTVTVFVQSQDDGSQSMLQYSEAKQ